MGVSTSYDALIDLFECTGNFLKHLNIYNEMPVTDGIIEIIVKITTEVLSVRALATNRIKQGRFSKYTCAYNTPLSNYSSSVAPQPTCSTK